MELTHIRFARDLKDRLSIEDADSYYAGAIYPDSRYLTKISRNQTHAGLSPQDPFAGGLSDFEKGWATHVLYDRLAHPQYVALSPWPEKKTEPWNDVWQFISAAKVVEDLQSYEAMRGEVEMILDIEFSERPNHEDPEVMRQYAQIQNTLYRQLPTLQQYREFWEILSGDKKIIDGVMGYVHEILDQAHLQSQIQRMYRQVIKALPSV